jgi:hypothetical protein
VPHQHRHQAITLTFGDIQSLSYNIYCARMRVRSDLALRLLLDKIIELGLSDHVRNLVEDGRRHMGDRSPYRGGTTLTGLLRQAIAAARAEDAGDTAERLEDALSYCMNVMLGPDLEIKYQLLSRARERHGRLLRSTLVNAAMWFADEAHTFRKDNPQASVDDLMTFLEGLRNIEVRERPGAPGTYTALRGPRETQAWLDETFRDRLHYQPDSGDTPLADASVEELADAVLLRARRRALDDLRAVVLNRHSSEQDLQRELEKNLWVFGGTYLAKHGPRRISSGIELDLTLLRPDGTVHVVELKRAAVPVLTHQRGRYVPTNEVHRAMTQTINYLVTLDEDRATLSAQGIDVRRASASVVVGHPDFEHGASEAEVDEALRVYNSHLSRVEVVTYKQLIDRAARSLDLR